MMMMTMMRWESVTPPHTHTHLLDELLEQRNVFTTSRVTDAVQLMEYLKLSFTKYFKVISIFLFFFYQGSNKGF